MQCFMRMMHDMKVVLSTHCHAMHQFTLPVQSDKMASSGLDTDDYIAIALALDKKKRKKRSKWSKCWLLKRNEISHTNLLEELRLEPQDYFNYMRMSEDVYRKLLSKVTPYIKRRNTHLRKAITPILDLHTFIKYSKKIKY